MRHIGAMFTLAALLLCGCVSTRLYSPLDKWLLRENAIPRYAAKFDIVYIGPERYEQGMDLLAMHSKAVRECMDKLESKTRVFAPLVSNDKDVEKALKRYLKLYHGHRQRPFVVLGQGRGGMLLHTYCLNNKRKLKRAGLILEYYSDAEEGDILDEKLAREIEEAYLHYHNRKIWGREIKLHETEPETRAQ